MQQDAIIIGGGFAGLSAAYILARARRKVTIIDSGEPRNRFAAHSHGALALDGKSGREILAEARTQLATYPTVTFVEGEADSAEGVIDDFHVRIAGQKPIAARRLLLASGMEDRLPDIPGLEERWGKTVLHCPYCHGYEIGGGPIGVLATHPMSAHQASVVADWGDVTLFTNGMPEPDDAALALLERRQVGLQAGLVSAIETGAGKMMRICLANGRDFEVRALFVGPDMHIRGSIAENFGCALEETPAGKIIATDVSKATSVAGIYAAGDIARAFGNITLASADGVMAGLGAHQSLMFAAAHS
ncbi:NAD(P)/FAD-dependent oxidoreductase [Pararhizobium sp. A13]|uniref:NAD(P)/FAD-dependent oxidoreductase n=1 Tax=Pararhizobium sp. A13 TaxID=3133975 RepID=UPI00324753BE